MKISSIIPHHGEEPFISGTKGSGAVFFTGCTMRCVYCQNHQISQEGTGKGTGRAEMAEKMLKLQDQGCHNINLVSPTQYAKEIVGTLKIAKSRGLKIPIVYNTNGYDKVDTLKMFNGLIDIYLPDIKYSDDKIAQELSGVPNYVARNKAAIIEMFRQVGNLELNENDIAKRGLIVRHLVLPNDLAGSFESLKFLARLSKDLWLSVMAQYHPCFKAKDYKNINRRISSAEYRQVLSWVESFGFENVLSQELESSDVFLPDFNNPQPFWS